MSPVLSSDRRRGNISLRQERLDCDSWDERFGEGLGPNFGDDRGLSS